jgi:hypothetical protein
MPKPRFGHEMEMGKSDQTLDVMSHDSTHVRLVIEAEKQSNIARSKALDILNKYSKDLGNDDECNDDDDDNNDHDNDEKKDEGRDDKQETIESYSSPYNEVRNQYIDNNDKEEIPCDDECDTTSEKDSVFDNKFDDITDEDLEHIARCLIPLSPKGLKKNRAKNISGRFEFKRINNGALAVVKSHKELHIMKEDEISKQAEKSNQSKPEKRGRKFGLKRRKSIRRARSRSRASRDFDSGIHTDDACLHDDQTVKDSSKLQMKAKASQKALNKKVKDGDLPPKPTPKPKEKPKRDRSVGAPSSRATASDIDSEEVISVVSFSSMSSMSEMSVAEKMKERGPIVLTQAMMDTAVIPDMICLKKNVKLTKIQVLKRKLSFSKGKI